MWDWGTFLHYIYSPYLLVGAAISLGIVPRGVDVVETHVTSRQPLVHDEALLAAALRREL